RTSAGTALSATLVAWWRRKIGRNCSALLVLLRPNTLLGAIRDLLCGVGFYPVRMLLGARECLAARLIVFRRPVCYLLLNSRHAIAGCGVIAHELRSAAASTLLFKFLEELGHLLGIVACLVHDDRAYCISLRLIAPRILKRQYACADSNPHSSQRANRATTQH